MDRTELNEKLNQVGLKIPRILFPREGINLSKFACIAADQFTQDPAYWDRVKKYVGDEPSTFNLIYPEAYMEQELANNKDNFENILNDKIAEINTNMNKYISDGIYEDIGECFIFVERKARSVNRRGLIVAIDLEKYDYNKGAKSLMRATELTVKERLVVREKIRENASLDIPHVLVLINDKEDKLFKKVESIKFSTFFRMAGDSKNDILYDFDLMEDSGYIKGYKIADKSDIEEIVDVLIDLKNDSEDGLLYAVGDGNHSLAAAKDVYDKTGRGRYALVELVNIHDDGLAFFPIHRLLINVDQNDFVKKTGVDPNRPPALQDLQKILDDYGCKIDYIHGKEECIELGKKKGNISITFDKFSYETLFEDVIKHGSLCRKSFSMGEAKDKRFYLEAQKIM